MRWFRNLLLGLIFVIAVAIIVGGYLFYDVTRGPLPQHSGTISVDGLNASVEIVRDDVGIPHIYASNTYDLFFAQGYTQAQDRWWQMEFSRHTGNGSLSKLIGENDEIRGVDVFIRTAGWRQAAEADLPELSDNARAVLEAFSDGVNAYITDKNPSDLAIEYSILGLTGVNFDIEPWTPIDSLVWGKVMAWDLGANRSRELTISRMLEDENISDEMVADFFPSFPFGEMPTILESDEIPLVADGASQAAQDTQPSRYTVGDVRFAGGVAHDVNIAFGYGLSLGSNNWVVSGDLTESGMPLMANDMHLSVGIPAIWYEVGLHCQPVGDDCPYDVRGFTFPAVPAVVAGHNSNIGWAFTNVGVDTQDLYMIRVNPEDPLQYEWNGEWRDMTVREETIVYGDGTESLTLTVRETHLGPIMNDNSFDDDGNLEGFNNENPLAMRWASTSETGTIFEAIFLLNQAANWDGFREALSFWDSPAQNVVYADVEGNIGYQMPGRFPIRAADHDGLTPVPGWTDEYEWQGFIEYDLLPRTFNPERGYIGSVNQTVADQDYWDALRAEIGADTNVYFQTQVAFGYRGVPLHERLESLAPHTIETFQQIHGDSYSHSAAQLLPYITQHDYGEADFNEYRDWLAEWDMIYTPDSAHALFYAHIWAALVNNLYNDDLPENGLASGNERVQWVTYQLMDDPDNEWWDDATTDTVETRDDILQVSFEEAVNRIVADFGDERDEWRWNAAHQVNLTHNPLGASGIEVIENVFNRGGYPTGGGDGVLNNMRWSTSSGTFEVQGSVVSMRSIVDFSDFSNSLTIIPTGQSGHPFSPQYDDQIEAWTTLNYHPMHFERGNVEATGGPVLRLEPAS